MVKRKSPRLRTVEKYKPPYSLNKFPSDFHIRLGREVIFYLATRRTPRIEGNDWEEIFARIIDAKWKPSNIGLDDVVLRQTAWGAKTVKNPKPATVKKIRLISGRNSPAYSYGDEKVTDLDENELGGKILDIWNERVSAVKKQFKHLRTIVLIKGEGLREVAVFEFDTVRYLLDDYWWRNYPVYGHPDFVFPNANLAVFIDGCFWHACPKHCRMPSDNKRYWEHKILRNAKRDRTVTNKLKRKGWSVIRFWEHDMKGGRGFTLKMNRLKRIVQEIMHSTHQFFLSRRSLYLLVLNGRQGHEDSDAEYWLNLIRSFGGDSPVIVVLNKQKEHPFDLNRQNLESKFPKMIKAFVKTECDDPSTGLDRLKDKILYETDRLDGLRDGFPEEWFQIKDELAGMDANYLTFEEYRKTCSRMGERIKTDQDRLAGYLHQLGVALNYKDDPRLRDMHALNPRWVTEGIYTILNAKVLEKNKGELHLKDLEQTLDSETYPSAIHIKTNFCVRNLEPTLLF